MHELQPDLNQLLRRIAVWPYGKTAIFMSVLGTQFNRWNRSANVGQGHFLTTSVLRTCL